MGKAIGLVEFKTVSSGITAADIMVKTTEVDIIHAETVCPGKYFVLIEGDLSAVRAAVDAASKHATEHLIDTFVLGNPHESLFGAIYGTISIENPKALGVLETYSVASAIVAADTAAKTAIVDLIELRLARGMCGKSYLLLTGEVSAVKSAIDKAIAGAGGNGMFLDSSVIAGPDEKLWKNIL